jgi:hypothetical protein
MGVTTDTGSWFTSKGSRNLSTLTMLVEAGVAFVRGNRRAGIGLLAAAALAYKWSPLGYVVEAIIRLRQWTG